VTERQWQERREVALLTFYSAERRLGAPPDLAWQRMEEFAKRFDVRETEAEQC